MARINAEQITVPQEGGIELDNERGLKTPSVIESDSANMNMDYAEMERFLHEPVTVMIHPSSVEGQLSHVPLVVQEDRVDVPRGKPVTIKRKFVEVLARARQIEYIQEVEDMNPTNIIPPRPRVSLSYPFDVIRDSEKGRTWYQTLFHTR